ncbi:MAG: GntR family transcriptional regulator [Lachnospiraceae bacterium]|uniref:GntR family transcriptional regulator n=1 Tax=Candidatus Weimeria bifida TaxID=2599074 RepID=A0A6N7J191_9FIRM|nr:GntR family transcriptional regulator [Candidatus Weimeria bifida]RRF97336.1 MAG: GntR family transcriptional regulator [Lachnospiraceae bacterium]
MELRLDMNSYLPLRDVVFQTLRDAILKGELEPGERLMEIHLANKLGVSRTPIREAIRMLEKEGLAVTIPRKGAQVAQMTEKDLLDVLEIRDALDELAVTDACNRMDEQDFKDLEKAMNDFVVVTKSDDVRAIVEADENFHNVIYRATKNPKLWHIIKNLKEQMYRYRYEYVKQDKDYSDLIEDHQKIVEGLKRKDVDYVKSVMHSHLQNQVDSVSRVIREQNRAGARKKAESDK